MFLSKEFLDEGGGGTAAPPSRGSAGGLYEDPSSRRPATGSSQMMRPTSASMHGRPGTANSGSHDHGGGGPAGEDLEATPMNAASLRQKMLQQRQRALAKQKSGSGMVLASSQMVMANNDTPSVEAQVVSPSGKTPLLSRSGTSGLSPVGGSIDRQSMFSDDRERSRVSLETAMTSMSLGEKDVGAIIMPEMSPEEIKEEEARRRSNLAQELDERGITPVYDPSGGVPAGPRTTVFDIGSISPSEFKSFLMNPVPKSAGMIECRIIRERTGLNKLFPKYTLESDAGVFMMTAKKQSHNKTSNYAISMNKGDCTKDSDGFLGKLRSNFLGLEFVAYSNGLNPKKIDANMSQVHAIQLARQELVAIQYSSSLWGGTKPRGPRKMSAVIPRVQANGERMLCRTLNPDTEGLLALAKADNTTLTEQYTNKPPKWNEQIGAFVLNFNKRVTQASVKNFQFTNADDPDTVFLQFGRVGKDVFNMDFRYPFSPFQAFAICLSSFDYKICCE